MYAIFILLTALLVACNPATDKNTAASKTSQPTNEYCEQFANNTAFVLNAKTSAKIGPFKDFVTGEEKRSCIIQTQTTGLQFANLIDAIRLLRAGLFSAWKEERAYQADSPTGTTTAFLNGGRLAIVQVNWEPVPEANCPKDQIITTCQLKPEQKLYTITIQAMQK